MEGAFHPKSKHYFFTAWNTDIILEGVAVIL